MTRQLLLLCLACILTACNGSSGKNNSAKNGGGTAQTEIIAFAEGAKTGQAVELFIYNPSTSITNIQWRQTSGENVTFLAPTSKAIAFTATTAGDYGFEVSFQVNGSTSMLSHTLTVSNESSLISARLGHAVIEGNKVSLRTTLAETLAQDSIVWRQISGPSISYTDNNTNGDLAVFFDAPEVSQDTMLEFEVSASNGGNTYTDTIGILVENAAEINNNAYFDEPVARVFPYNSNSPYADNLVACVYDNTLSSSCTFNALPLIAEDSTLPSVNDIMDRVVVSHQWMGDRFKQLLENYDLNNDFKNLLRATTAIVISYDIRPSFYWVATGAIYLDAENFWLTADERDTINEAPDYRADFGNDLQFVMPWRFVKNNQYAYTIQPKENRASRSLEDALYRVSDLMYHELAHANDFFPSTEWFSHQGNERILDAAQTTDFESDQLAIVSPLQNMQMRNLAQVSFHGETANATQKAYLPEDIKTFFSPDLASDYYNYSSTREDYAMLFDEFMMQVRFGILRDVAITNQPTGNNITANDYIVTWGQRGRIGEPLIKPRVNFVVERVLPEIDAQTLVANLPTPIAMIAGNNWIENLMLSENTNNIKNINSMALPRMTKHENIKANVNTLRYFHKALPKH
ncbi:hypothetical protein AAD001_08985 [Colwelliaceae bacterium 6471]